MHTFNIVDGASIKTAELEMRPGECNAGLMGEVMSGEWQGVPVNAWRQTGTRVISVHKGVTVSKA